MSLFPSPEEVQVYTDRANAWLIDNQLLVIALIGVNLLQ